ncbi:asparagine synthase (glutamine-hydrolyzing) [Novosphingobium sp. G106]|uniref:asparagine synthase (glutamine-hydrolyzing) n=1 Tax=Novosphingobium sp. G106 TaxID=2849500 RepID=UPI001C2DC84E|nr:asparagine synthase (glutamine-hydrolyzing) [Novosphingobium sp. G106]MBV1689808.1 asparagine synthase (glutamine-hydrolyzing) [Novosphingobium sp. G106]
MCGIFGFVSPRAISTGSVLASLSTIAHRGPDGTGVAVFADPAAHPVIYGSDDPSIVGGSSVEWRPMPDRLDGEAAIVLGHQRLAIVELSVLGHQPMASEDRSTWIIFNGEIYNHVELRGELIALGHSFRGHSDTEVILAAYREWGTDCLQRFNGMWAFALIDQRKQMLFLARDRFGVKPLYLWKDHGAVHFGSEIKAFLPHPRFSVRPDREHVRSYLRDGPSEWLDTTIYQDVVRLRAGSMIYAPLSADIDLLGDQQRWWQLETDSSKEPYDRARAEALAEEYARLLDDSVRIRLRADVPVGSALSGGLDSSSVVYLAARALGETPDAPRQHSFSSVYRTPGTEACDESAYIREVAQLCGVTMNTIEPDPEDVPEQHARMIWHMDTPPESTCMSGWHTFKLVQQTGIKVTLDGQGADEQLGGYLFYLPHRLAGVSLSEAAREFAGIADVHPRRLAAGSLGISLLQRSRLMAVLPGLADRHRKYGRSLSVGMNRHLLMDAQTSLANLIHYADRTSMAFGVESRMPFLDVRLASFLARVPEAYKIHRGWTKFIARRAFDGKLPDSVIWRKDKLGWPIPEKQWAEGPLRAWFDRPRAQLRRFTDWGVGDEYATNLNAASMGLRVRALNLVAWADTFADGGWKSRI